MTRHRRSARNTALVMVYAMMSIVILMAFTSLAVDWGRVETAKTELQNATDAAARYAVTGISDNTYSTKATNAAANNKVDGVPLALQAADVTLGTWNFTTRAFSAGGSSPNAVRVLGHRSAARGTAIPLLFARAIGRNSCDINTVSVATLSSPPCDIAGLSLVKLTGSGMIQRLGTESGTVNVAGNGTYSLSWGQQIAGNVYYYGSPPNVPNGANCITGTQTAMSSQINFATPTTPGGCTPVYAATYSGTTFPVPAGNYSATSLTITSGATLNLSGDVNVYCSGPVSIGGGAIINTNNGAYKFTIYQTTASSITLNVGTIYMRIYAPLSTVNVSGSTVLIGSVIADTLNNANIIKYSSALPSPISPTGGGGSSGGGISTVE